MSTPRPDTDEAGPGDGIAVRTVLLGDLPMLVATVGGAGRGPLLWSALEERGLAPVAALAGADLPRGVRVGFMLARQELRLADERDDTLMRVPRGGLDAGWLTAAGRLKGTMTFFVRGGPISPDLGAQQLAAEVNRRAGSGEVIGAIVGYAEERLSLPLVF